MSVRAFFGKLMFSEMKYLVRLARKKVLQPEDMPALPKHLDPQSLPFDDNSLDFSGAKNLLVSMLRAGKPLIVPALALNLTYVMLNLTKPVLVNNFVKTISGDITNPDTLPLALVLAVLLGSVSFVASLAIQQYFLRSLGAYQVFTNAVNRRIYRHSLMLSQRACSRTQLGDIVNHMSSDSDAISDLGMMLGDLTVSVVTVLGVSGLLFYYLGYTAFVSVTLLLLIVPLTRLIAKKFSTLEDVLMKHRDKRVTLMSQALNGIRVVKYFAWEKSVSKEVGGVRKKELAVRRQLARSEALATLSYTAVSTLVLFASLAFHVSRGFSLTPELVFTCVSLFAILEDPFGHLSEVIARVANAFVGADRISKFIQQESLKGIQISEALDEKAPGVEIDSLTVRYEDRGPNVLSGVSVRLLAGQSLAVVGKVGAGKSTLLQSLLRELPAAAGSVAFRDLHGRALNPRIAFVPQEAFIINGSLKDNILFGEKDDHDLLQRALEASGLETDLHELPAGLFTEIGEKGVNLSGGQKQRVSLARSVLQRPALVLLDDPLSAVDVHTESLLVDKLLFGQWQGVTRVVTTHRLAHLHRFDKVLFLQDGRAAAYGALEDILRDCPAFAAFYSESAQTEHASMGLQPAKERAAIRTSEPQKESRLTDDEDRAIGAVKSSVYVDYVKALGGVRLRSRVFFLPLLVMGTATAAALPLLQKSWLGLSANAQTGLPFTAPFARILEPLASNTMQSVLVYGVLGVLTLLGVLANKMLWLERGMSAGRSLHDSMLASVLRAPLRFFDATPAGRIIQRFSRDVEAVDIQLQWSFETTVRCLVNIATALFLILGVLPVMGFAVLPILFFYYLLQRDYRVPAREAKRLDAISRSPRYAHFKETLQGLVVIRAFGKTNLFTQAFYERLHHSQRMFFGHYMLNRWFSSRIPLLGGVISSLTAIAIVFYAHHGMLTAGIAGLVMVYALSLWESLNWAVRIFSEVEAKMTSVERIKYYSSLDQERDVAVTPPLDVDKDWPTQGEIVFDRVVARYAPHLPPVLKEISLRVPAGARVGIIGRTGSGKSTMLQALYRCMELEQGEIRIDGKNIAQVPLEQLRRSLAIIPQDPTLFMGSLRSNLDRYDEYTDEELWLSLKNAGLEAFVNALPNGLDSAVSESGANLSQGQRQLLCLARALLAKAQIIVMDEATASVDVQTDIMVQEIVRTTCKHATMVIIAHRLGTVADCDLIFELREGRLHRTLDLKKQTEHAPIDA